MSSVHEYEAPTSGRLDALLSMLNSDLSRARVTKLIRQGQVELRGEVVTRPSAKVREGDRLRLVVPNATPSELVAQDLPLEIVYEDADIVVINKAPGRVVHPGAGHPDGTLVNALLHHVKDLSGIGGVERPGIVHRLDKGTSGLLVVAKHDQAHQHLAAQFATHSAHRRYLAIVFQGPDKEHGTIESTLARHPTDRIRFASTDGSRGKFARTHWWLRGQGRKLALMECRLETGRTHQIRVHLTEQGWPLIGDPLYTRRNRKPSKWLQPLLPPERPMLHAWRLYLAHPRDDRPLSFAAEIPQDFRRVLNEAAIEPPQSPLEE